MTTLTLYQISDEYAATLALADLDMDEQTIADTLEGLSGALEAKAQNVAMFARNLEASAAAIREAEQQMAARRKAIESRAERVREYIKANMLRTGISKIECPYFAIAIKNNPASVVVDDVRAIPADFMRQPEPPPPEPDKKAIGTALKAGNDVPGCHLDHGTRLEIK
jgi:hypothetical protein